MKIKVVRLWDDGYRLALLREGSKWCHYVTMEAPIRVRKVKIKGLAYKVVEVSKPDLIKVLKARHAKWGGSVAALSMINS